MSIGTPNSPFVCYLFHFDKVFKGRQHYIGSTKYERRFVRWREHALGNASAYTAQFIREGIGFQVVRLWFTDSRAYERVLKDGGSMAAKCPLCTPSLPQPTPLHFDPMAWSPTIDAHWHNRKRPQQIA